MNCIGRAFNFLDYCVNTTISWMITIGQPILQRKDGYCTLAYYDQSKEYVFRFKSKRRMIKANSILNGGICVTQRVLRYAGPFGDFHGIPTTPGDLGYDELTVYANDGNIKYTKGEVIAPL